MTRKPHLSGRQFLTFFIIGLAEGNGELDKNRSGLAEGNGELGKNRS